MKGGALPSLSSGDHLPGPATATPGLCYVPHKSVSCFTDALPRRGAALICHAELPGKFFCCVIDTANACLLLLLPLVLFFSCAGLPPMLNSYREFAASVIVSALTSTRPHQNVASLSKNAHPASWVDSNGVLVLQEVPPLSPPPKHTHTLLLLPTVAPNFDRHLETPEGIGSQRTGRERDQGLVGSLEQQ